MKAPDSPPPAYEELKARLAKLHDLKMVRYLLEWDARTVMPARGADARVEQIASVERARHERLAEDEIGELLEAVRPFEASLDPDCDDARLIVAARREYEKAVLVPGGLHGQLARASAAAEQSWREARERSDFALLRPRLEEVVELKRAYIECFDFSDPYDALLDDFEPGMTTAEVAAVLDELKVELLPLAGDAADRAGTVDDSFLHGRFPVDSQQAIVREVLRALPFEAETWRLDQSAHPFTTSFSTSDVRVTNRYSERELAPALLTALHEFGHALYEGGVDPALERTPLAEPTSLALHESQSKLWENAIGRSLPFWRHFFPVVQRAFPAQLRGVDAEAFHRAVNRVRRSLVRVDADEFAYDLHIVLRFELERDLFAGRLEVRDLPAAWNERVHSYLGLDVRRDADGVLQDVHWSEGAFGYFPTYSLGNVIAGQLWQAAGDALPDLAEQVERGEFGPLREWLRESVHRHGSKFSAPEIVRRVTGGPIDTGPYVSYLREKLSAVYGVPAAR